MFRISTTTTDKTPQTITIMKKTGPKFAITNEKHIYNKTSLINLFNIKEGGIKPTGYLLLYLRNEGIHTWFDRCSCSSQCVLKVEASSNICSHFALSMF